MADVALVDPPQDVADVHQRFVAAANESASLVEQLADDVEGGRVTCGQEWNHRAYGLPSTEEGMEAIEDLGRRGYQVSAFAGD